MRQAWRGILVLMFLLLAACGDPSNHQHNGNMDHSDHMDIGVQALNVDLQVPSQAQIGQTIEIKAIVSLGQEKLDHVDEIEFEIWKDDDSANGEMIKVDPASDNGIYSIEKSFTEAGVYSIQSHVTAHNMHNMPIKHITVVEVP